MANELNVKMRFRYVYMVLGSIFAVLLLLLSDPGATVVTDLPFGASTVANIVLMLRVVLFVALLHVSRKGLFDYIDLETVFNAAMRTPEGAGKVFIGMGIFALAISVLIYAAVK
jgi:hypothetical protein